MATVQNNLAGDPGGMLGSHSHKVSIRQRRQQRA